MRVDEGAEGGLAAPCVVCCEWSDDGRAAGSSRATTPLRAASRISTATARFCFLFHRPPIKTTSAKRPVNRQLHTTALCTHPPPCLADLDLATGSVCPTIAHLGQIHVVRRLTQSSSYSVVLDP